MPAETLWRPSPSERLRLAIVRDGSSAQLAVEINKKQCSVVVGRGQLKNNNITLLVQC
jgi:hypothetical protein